MTGCDEYIKQAVRISISRGACGEVAVLPYIGKQAGAIVLDMMTGFIWWQEKGTPK
jgi:hypothetical protein